MAMGRPQKPFKTIQGDLVPGLYRIPRTNRWRIIATGERFTEVDEHLAVARFYNSLPVDTITLYDKEINICALDTMNAEVRDATAGGQEVTVTVPDDITKEPTTITRKLPHGKQYWAWMREMLINDPLLCARMTGLPQLASFLQWEIPKRPIKIAELVAVYRRENAAKERTKTDSAAALDRLVRHAGAVTLADLTQEKLNAFKAEIESTIPGPATRASYYGKIKSVIGFGLKVGLDAVQIRQALDRCKVLWTSAPMPSVQPRPISREDFHTLLAAGNGTWRAWLLLGLNLCLHIDEVCGLRWADFDLTRGTYAAIREKTKRARIPRAAVLWPETLEALKAMPRKSEFVFTSTHGTRFNRNSRVTEFAKLRKLAGLPDDVTFDTLRDGAYTAACQGTVDEKWARVLAGHASPGLQDNYVLRNPEATKPACEAVYRVYGPFPAFAAKAA